MRFGIIAEGDSDQVVIRNILKSFGIDKSDVLFIKPNNQQDETDLVGLGDQTIGTFQGVKNACLGNDGKRPYFIKAFEISDVQYMIIHLDTAEIDNQNFSPVRPIKTNNPNYSTELRAKTIELINTWLENNYQEQLLYAISIEEIEAWCLTVYAKKGDVDTANSANPKSTLSHQMKGKKSNSVEVISEYFRKKKRLDKCTPFNQSLKDFVDSVELVVNPI
jgi:hypothetical protein